jgi:hypothetical protein
LNTDEPEKTVDVNGIHNTWLQTTDEAIWREVCHPTPLPFLTCVHLEAGEILTSKQLAQESFVVCRENIVWICGQVFSVLPARAVDFKRRARKPAEISVEWKYNFLVDSARNMRLHEKHLSPLGHLTFEDYCG